MRTLPTSLSTQALESGHSGLGVHAENPSALRPPHGGRVHRSVPSPYPSGCLTETLRSSLSVGPWVPVDGAGGSEGWQNEVE